MNPNKIARRRRRTGLEKLEPISEHIIALACAWLRSGRVGTIAEAANRAGVNPKSLGRFIYQTGERRERPGRLARVGMKLAAAKEALRPDHANLAEVARSVRMTSAALLRLLKQEAHSMARMRGTQRDSKE